MSDMHEAVALPDPAVKRLLHPTDLPDARSLYVRGWWFGRLCSAPILLAIAAIVWTISGSLGPPLLAVSSTLAIGLVGSRWHEARAWDFIPRKRQASDGPAFWQLLAVAMDAAALLIAAVAVLIALRDRVLADGVLAFAVGALVGVAVVQGIELVVAIVGKRTWVAIVERLVMLVAVSTTAAIVAASGQAGTWTRDAYAAAVMGAATILLAQSIWWIVVSRSARPSAAESG